MTLIVALLTNPASASQVLDAAAVAAAAVPGGEVETFHARLKPESTITTEEIMNDARRAELIAVFEQKADALRRAVDAWAAAYPGREPPRWNEAEGSSVAAIVADRAKSADLFVLVRPAEHEGKEALHAAIFDTGRLLLLVPPAPAPAASFGRQMAIAWKASDQASRAITAAIPWLKHAARVSLLIIEDGDASRSTDDALALLEPHGITPEPVILPPGEERAGEQLLRTAHTIGGDCLVMGAYRHNRLLEMILGGVTQHMLDAADLPLFLIH